VYPATLERLLQLGVGTAPGCRLLTVQTIESGRQPPANRHMSAASAGRTPDVQEQTKRSESVNIYSIGLGEFQTLRDRASASRRDSRPLSSKAQWYLMALDVEPSMQQRGDLVHG
jgi:hypothetical protein